MAERTDYALAVPRDARGALAAGWLLLGTAALAASGVLAVLLVLARTPGVSRLVPAGEFFRVALVAHVDLSVLVWFVAFAGASFTLNSTQRFLPLGRAALALAAVGAAIVALAPFAGDGTPIMANYIPVVDGAVFLAGVGVFGVATTLLVARGFIASPRVGLALDAPGVLRFGMNAALVAVAVALIAFAWSALAVPRDLASKAYYELVFWGGGHVLQFAWTLLVMIAWLVLAEASGLRVPLSPRVVLLLFALQLAAVFATTLVYAAYDVASVPHHRLHTWLMRFGGALALPPVAVAVAWGWCRAPRGRMLPADARPLRAALVTSIALMGLGGGVGYLIHGSNVRIPAHYHGAIVGVTVALMGVTYWLLPRLGYAAPPPRLATWQPFVYGGGQALHVAGLLWSGGYGVQRKVAGAEQVLRSASEVAGMGLMGAGGLIAIVGGMLFVVAVARSVTSRARRRAAHAPAT